MIETFSVDGGAGQATAATAATAPKLGPDRVYDFALHGDSVLLGCVGLREDGRELHGALVAAGSWLRTGDALQLDWAAGGIDGWLSRTSERLVRDESGAPAPARPRLPRAHQVDVLADGNRWVGRIT